MKSDYTTNSRYLTYTFYLERLGECTFLRQRQPVGNLLFYNGPFVCKFVSSFPPRKTPNQCPSHRLNLWWIAGSSEDSSSATPPEISVSSLPLTPTPSPASPQFVPAMDVDHQTESNHDTALTLATAGGHDELVNLLLDKAADIEHRDKKGPPTLTWPGHPSLSYSNLSCPVLSYPILSFPILSSPILSNLIQSHPIQSNLIPSNSIQSNPIPSCPIQSYPIPSCPILSYPIPSYPMFFFFQSYPIQSHPSLSCPIPFSPILLYLFLFSSIPGCYCHGHLALPL